MFRNTKNLTTFLLLLISSCYSSVYGSGDPNVLLKKWNAVITNNFSSVSEIEGRTFIAGNYNAQNPHQFGFKLTSNSSQDVVFAVGGTVNTDAQANIKVFYGSAAVSTAVTTPNWFQFMNGGSLQASSTWPAVNSPVQDLVDAANYWKTLTPNGKVQYPGSQPAPLSFICPSGQKLAVFSVTDVQTFENSNVQQIEITPADSTQTIIINVLTTDGNVQWTNGNMVGNFDNEYWRSRIIWNIYYDNSKCTMGTINCGPNMKGTLVSPEATVTGNSNFDGTVVCKNLQINSEIHLASSTGWNGNAPCQATPASLGDKVWLDVNKNGIQDAGEAGIANVTVVLFNSSNTQVATTTTDASGNYSFTNLAPGTYSVQFTAPSGYTISVKDQGTDDSKDSDIDPSTGKTASVTLAAGQNNTTVDAGMYVSSATLGDKVWLDANQNGIQDAGEAGIANVTVVLFNSSNTQVATTTTDANGNYSFTNLAPGTYSAQFTAPSGYTISAKDQGTDDSKDSDIDPSTGKTASVTLIAGQNNTTVDAGMYVTPASLGDKVWLDVNKNGIQDAGEAGIANVTVVLFNSSNTQVATTTTDANGNYSFTNLAPGTYSAQFTAPSGYTISAKDQGTDDGKDSDIDPSTGKTASVTLIAGQNNTTVDAGMYVTPASLGDKVWLDANQNGIQDAGEAGIANVIVVLFNSSNTQVATTTTDASGNYSFTNLAPGTYSVQFTAPSGYTISPKDQGTDDSKDSDIDPVTGKTGTYTLTAGQNNTTVDAGMYVTPASLGDKVWLDVNQNGIQDAGEAGIANVTVKLYDCSSNLIGTTTTNANGSYSFTNVTPGSYNVHFVLPSGYSFSPMNAGSDSTKDSDADLTTGKTACFVLAPGQSNITKDAGLYLTPVLTATLGDRVWLDANHNGIQDNGEAGLSNVTVKLYSCSDSLVATTATNSLGNYQFTNVTPGSYYVKFVSPVGYTITAKDQDSIDSLDSDADALTGKTGCYTIASGEMNNSIDAGMYINFVTIGDKVWNDANHNGIQDAGETGISNVTVSLFNCSNNLISTTVTDANGNYQFCCTVSGGNYYVQFSLPSGYAFTTPYQGNDSTKDSNADTVTGKTACTYIAGGETNNTLDAGMYQLPVNIGDKVWNDANKNGIQDAGEAGIPNVTVKLYNCSGVLTATTATDANGFYHFNDVLAGSYYIQVTASAGYAFSLKNQGTNISVDSDINPETGKSDCKAFAAGSTDNSIDAGLYYGATDLKIEKTVSDSIITCGQNVTYTIKLTNNGPIDASGIVASDILPAGLVFVSANATQGAYDQNTGLWTVGSLSNGASVTLTINVKVDCASMNNANIDLGPAKDFNVFVINDITQPSADTQGKMAVGRNATLACYSVADQLAPSNGTVDVLVVGKKLIFTSGGIYAGNAVYGDSSNLPVSAVSFFSGSVRKDSVINFAAAKTYLENLSSQLSGYSVNGTTEFQWGTVRMTCNDPYLNVFTVNGNDLNTANTVEINVPNGSAVVVNIVGTTINWHGGLFVNGTVMNNVLYNFPQTTSLSISGIDVTGSILAPFAAVNFPAGVQHGQMICKSMTGSGQFNLAPFLGNIPANKAIVNVASIISSNISDPVLANNTVSASSSFPHDTTGTGSGSGSGIGSGSWSLIGNLPAGEIVTTIESDHQGGIYAGTVNGYIFKTTNEGASWVRVNSNMYSGPVWAVKIHPNSSILAATVTGVYRTSDNGANWNLTDLQYKDVRSLKIDASGTVYAGTWGFGIFVSSNCGLSWTAENNGLGTHLVITSLTVAPDQAVYAGTFDGGVAKSIDHGSSWTFLNVGYNYIWALASNSNGDLFAGTYGEGLYRSTTNGATWTKTSLPVTYVYSLVIDAADNIYAASYSGGVFVSTNNGTTWSNIGMGGVGLSSMMIVPNGKAIYSGTANGKVYKKESNLTGINDKKRLIPTELHLEQNYPNPFNPSTRISFALPKAQQVSLVIYNTLGQVVKTLVNGSLEAGNYTISFEANSLASGIYIYRLQTQSQTFTKKMILQK